MPGNLKTDCLKEKGNIPGQTEIIIMEAGKKD
jgi:hypothetical protein